MRTMKCDDGGDSERRQVEAYISKPTWTKSSRGFDITVGIDGGGMARNGREDEETRPGRRPR